MALQQKVKKKKKEKNTQNKNLTKIWSIKPRSLIVMDNIGYT